MMGVDWTCLIYRQRLSAGPGCQVRRHWDPLEYFWGKRSREDELKEERKPKMRVELDEGDDDQGQCERKA